MATLYGATVFRAPNNSVNYHTDSYGTNSAAFTAGDTVKIASGLMAVAGTTDQVDGVVVKTQTMTSSNQTVAKVQPAYIPMDQDYEFLMGTNADLSATTSIGVYYKLTAATTGTLQVDVTSGAQTGNARVVLCTGVDPQGKGGTGAGSGLREGLFKFVKVKNIKSDVTSA
jgi:hypothetical protein